MAVVGIGPRGEWVGRMVADMIRTMGARVLSDDRSQMSDFRVRISRLSLAFVVFLLWCMIFASSSFGNDRCNWPLTATASPRRFRETNDMDSPLNCDVRRCQFRAISLRAVGDGHLRMSRVSCGSPTHRREKLERNWNTPGGSEWAMSTLFSELRHRSMRFDGCWHRLSKKSKRGLHSKPAWKNSCDMP